MTTIATPNAVALNVNDEEEDDLPLDDNYDSVLLSMMEDMEVSAEEKQAAVDEATASFSLLDEDEDVDDHAVESLAPAGAAAAVHDDDDDGIDETPAAAAATAAVAHRSVVVDRPRFVSSYTNFSGSGGHWVFRVATAYADGSESVVERRFGHFLALERRLRRSRPGAVLPPTPDRRSDDDDGPSRSSAEFARVRAVELGAYADALLRHPVVRSCDELGVFLGRPDLGTAWPETSDSTLTFLSSVVTAENVTKLVNGVDRNTGLKYKTVPGTGAFPKDDPLLVSLEECELERSDRLTDAGTKLFRDASSLPRALDARDASMSTLGMECRRAVVAARRTRTTDGPSVADVLEVLAGAALRDGRASRALDLRARLGPLERHVRTTPRLRDALVDRRVALLRYHDAAYESDRAATRLLETPDDDVAAKAGRRRTLERARAVERAAEEEADRVGRTVRDEVGRLRRERETEWPESLADAARRWRRCCEERRGAWEAAARRLAATGDRGHDDDDDDDA